MATDAAQALKNAQTLVSKAIIELAEVGPAAPNTVREAMPGLGSAFNSLGWADPSVKYSLPRDGDG